MTNKETASSLADRVYSLFVNSAYLKGGNALEGTAEMLIERALDEKDKQWGEAIVDALSDEPKKLIEAYDKGQKEMRERAALICEQSVEPSQKGNFCECTKTPHELATDIRSLPIEGE
jgi:hypothetical protein